MAIEHRSGNGDRGVVMPEIVGTHDCEGNHFAVIRVILSIVSPLLEFGVAGALLVVM
jgi:hypothetical protein